MAGAAPTTAFGQAVIGPPGSGKTTYCLGMSEFLRALGRRVAVVNLDPANEGLPYECAVDVGVTGEAVCGWGGCVWLGRLSV